MTLHQFYPRIMKFFFLFLAFASACHALSSFDTLTTKSGRTYNAVAVTKQEPDGLRITHAEGSGKILFTDLPDDILIYFDYDPSAAEAHQQSVRESLQQAQARRQSEELNKKISDLLKAKAIIFNAQIFQVVEGGLLAKNAYASEEVEFERERLVSKGLLLTPDAKELVRWREKVTRQRPLSPDDNKMIFLECDNTGLVDSQRIGGIVWPIGTYTYTTQFGASKTVPRYTNDPTIARRHLSGR
jgi:hypothetical protein